MTGDTVLVWSLGLVSRLLPRPRLASFDSEEALVFVNPLSSVRPFLSVEPYQSVQTSQS